MATLFNTKISNTYEGLIKTIDNLSLNATLREITDGKGTSTGIFLNSLGDFKVLGVLEFGSLKDTGTGVTITQFVTSTNGIENFDNDTTIPTSKAVKTYVDNNQLAQDLDFSGNTGTGRVAIDSEIFSITGSNGISTSASGAVITISGETLETAIASNLTSINTNSASITTNANGIATNVTNITTNASGIASNLSNINTNTGNISTNTGNISTNASGIATNASGISTNASSIVSNTNIINSNTGNISTNTGNISNNTSNIATNVTNIATNTSGVSTNAGNISTNTTNISTNTGSISTNVTNIATNVSGIASNVNAINTNSGNISTNTSNISTNASGIATNITNIGTNSTGIATNVTNISTNVTDIAANTAAISTGASGSATNAANIATNVTNISANDVKIATNVTNIAANVTDINAANVKITTNENNIAANSSNITANTSGIATNVVGIAANLSTGTTNTNNISTNTAAVATNVSNISTNASGIATNLTSIGNLNTSVATNSADIDTNETDIAANLSSIGANTTSISTNTTNIATNVTDIAANTAAISTGASGSATNAANIATNVTNIATNVSNIATNTSGIASNVTNIGTNTSAIATNTTGIASNVTNIATNTTGVATNVSSIGVNSTAIASNVSNISTNATGISTNTTNISTNTSGIATNVTNIATNTADIATGASSSATNASNIATNVTNIATNATNITGNTSAISSNAAGIATNVTNIATNTSGVAANLSSIAATNSNVSTNTSAISTNATNIAANTSSVATNTSGIATNVTSIAANATNIGTNDTDIATNVTAISTINTTAEFLVRKGAANGYVPLDANSKILETYLPESILGQLTYEGVYDAATDTPTLPSPTGVKGEYYIVDVAGTYLGVSYEIGDWIISNGVDWQKVDNTDAVKTVFGRLGNILAVEADYSAFYPLKSELATEVTNRTNADTALAANIATNVTNIATNATNIGTNTSGVASNLSNISTNTTNIGTNTSGVAANLSSIGTNTTNIAANVTTLGDKVDISSIVNDLTTGGTAVPLSAQQGVVLAAAITSGGTTVVNNLASTSTTSALAANQGRVLNGKITTATNAISTNTTNIATNTSGIATNVSNISTNTSGISTNATGISTNATNIASNDTDISANTTAIGTNTTGIATNVSGIATNVTAIAANATAIGLRVLTSSIVNDLTTGGTTVPLSAEMGKQLKADIGTSTISVINALDSSSTIAALAANQGRVLKALVDTNVTNIATNATGIATNVTNIATNASGIATNVSGISTNATAIATNATNIATNATNIGNKVSANNSTVSITTATGLDGATTFTLNRSTAKTIALALNLNELGTGNTLESTDHIVAVNGTANKKQLISSIPLSIFDNDGGFTNNTGTTTASNTQTFTNKSGSNNQWTNDAGYITSAQGNDGTVTSVTAGSGMTQTGTSTINPTLNVIGGDGIDSTADEITVDSTVVRTSGAQTIGGIKTFSNDTELNGNVRIGDGKYLELGALYLQDGGAGRIGFNRDTSNGDIHDSTYNAFQLQVAAAGASGKLEIQEYNGAGAYQGSTLITGNSITLNDYIIHNGDANTFFGFSNNDNFLISTGGNNNVSISASFVALRYAGNTKLTTTTSGISVSGNVDVNLGEVQMTDGYSIQWGGNAILNHTGSQTRIGDNTSANVLTLAGGNATFAGNVIAGSNSVQNGANPGLKVISTNTSQTVLSIDNTTTRNYELAVGGTASGIGSGSFYIYDGTAAATRLVIDTSGNATFANSIIGPDNFKAIGSNMKLFAGGTQVLNIDVNRNIYPNTHNSTDLGFSPTLAFRQLYLSGNISSTAGATFAGSVSMNAPLTISTNDSTVTIKDAGTNATQIVASAGDELYIGSNNTYQLQFTTGGNANAVSNWTFDNQVTTFNSASGPQLKFLEPGRAYTEGMRIIRFEDNFGFHYGENANEEAFTVDKLGNSTAHKNLTINGNLLGNTSNTTELGVYSTNAIKRIRMVQGGELHFGDTTVGAPLGITEGSWNNFGDSDNLSIYSRTKLVFYSGSTAAVYAGEFNSTGLSVEKALTTAELNLPSNGMIDWQNGDARIIEGEVGGYSLSFEIYNGTALERTLLLEKNMDATFKGTIFAPEANLGSLHQNFSNAEFYTNTGFQNYNDGFATFTAGLNNLANADMSFAIGHNSQARGVSSFAGGAYGGLTTSTKVYGTGAFAYGQSLTVYGQNSAAFGRGNQAGKSGVQTGNQAFAIGYLCKAWEDNSFAGGNDSNAFGPESMAFGAGAVASKGDSNIALGQGVTTPTNSSAANGQGQVAVGKYNVFNGGVALNFSVGTGTANNNRKSGFVVKNNGYVGINRINPSYWLHLGTNSAAKPSSSTWIVTSDERIKTNVKDYEKGLKEILAIRPVSYDYNGKAGFDKNSGGIGVIAQEIQKVMPECVHTYDTLLNEDDKEETELLNFDSNAITFALINSIKELKAEIEELKKQIK